jgi:hypothetical protein
VTGVAPGIVDNTDPNNPVVQAQFGSDTTVKLANAVSTLVKSLELVNSLTTNTAGSEASKWLIEVLQAGAQVTGLSVEGTKVGIPDTLYFNGETTTNINRNASGSFFFHGAGSALAILSTTGLLLAAGLPITFSSTWSITSNFHLYIAPLGTNGDVVIGAAGANATNSTNGFLQIPTCAGVPTGTPSVASGKVPLVYDSTDNKLYVYEGAAWHVLATAT